LPSCEGVGRVVPGPPTVWVAGLTADLSRNWEGEVGQMRGSLRAEVLRVPAASRWSGGPRPRKNTPCGGLAVLRALDNYQMFTERLLMRSFTTSPGKAGLRVQAGDRHTRVNGAACRGPPVVRERSGVIRTLRPIGSRVLSGWRDEFW
jgi:hypothetical protein